MVAPSVREKRTTRLSSTHPRLEADFLRRRTRECGGQYFFGALTWNANAALQKLNINDPFTSASTQSCSYLYDDLSRLSQADCGSGKWGQSFSFDALGNISKSVLSGCKGRAACLGCIPGSPCWKC